MKPWALLALVGVACAPAAVPDEHARELKAPHSEVPGPGPAIGQTLPPFEASDQAGRVWTFQSLRGPKGLVLNVNRSVVW